MKPLTLLLLDDSPDDHTITTVDMAKNKLFNRILYRFTVDDALDALRDHEVDVCLVDINLVSESGLDFIEQAKKEGLLENVPCIAVSGMRDEKDMARASQLGVKRWNVKPLTFATLHDSLIKVMGDRIQTGWVHQKEAV